MSAGVGNGYIVLYIKCVTRLCALLIYAADEHTVFGGGGRRPTSLECLVGGDLRRPTGLNCLVRPAQAAARIKHGAALPYNNQQYILNIL